MSKYISLGLLALVIVHGLVQLIFCCGKLLQERIEGGIAQAAAQEMMQNILKDKEEEKEDVLGLVARSDYKGQRPGLMVGQRSLHRDRSWDPGGVSRACGALVPGSGA